MAWRIDEQIVRGEIDCRVKGRVTGRLWLAGRAPPVELALAGCPWRDLAGRRLTFENPTPRLAADPRPAPRQTGVAGDLTASRKVKVPEIPLDQIHEYAAAGRPFPWHWGNSVYFEWFSEANGRVVIESANYRLAVSPEATWEMTAAEEAAQRKANEEVMARFLERLGGAVDNGESAAESAPEDSAPGAGDPAETRPITEEEADRLLSDSERLADRIAARMEREGLDEEDFERILAEELERQRKERGEPPPTPAEAAEHEAWIDEVNRATEEAGDDPDPELAEELAFVHPLQRRAYELVLALRADIKARGWRPDDAQSEHPLAMMVDSAMGCTAKLAGSLNGRAYPPPVEECGSVLARLRRARGHLDDALLAVESALEEHLAEQAWLEAARGALLEISLGLDRIVAELRERLGNAFN